MSDCPFCARVTARAAIIHAEEAAVAFPDHSRSQKAMRWSSHADFSDALRISGLTNGLLFALVRRVCRELAEQKGADGVNIGVNSGAAAGQTIDHVHVHVIPRRFGDVLDPRGGVRHVLPSPAEYWSNQ